MNLCVQCEMCVCYFVKITRTQLTKNGMEWIIRSDIQAFYLFITFDYVNFTLYKQQNINDCLLNICVRFCSCFSCSLVILFTDWYSDAGEREPIVASDPIYIDTSNTDDDYNSDLFCPASPTTVPVSAIKSRSNSGWWLFYLMQNKTILLTFLFVNHIKKNKKTNI